MNYHLRTLGKDLIVSSVNYENPLCQLRELTSILQAQEFSGQVVFDLLCVNGLSRNRFVTMFFDSSFDRKSKAPFNSSEVEAAQFDFYKQHPSFLDSSVLPDIQVKQFLNS